MSDDGLKLNNKELVGRALDVIQTALQDLIISEMKYNHGLDWWNVAIVPNLGRYKLPIDIPRHPEVTDDEARIYMDIPLCYALIKSEDILPEGYRRDANSLLYEMKDVRNKKSHFGKPSYSAKAAREAIGILIQLNDKLDLGVGKELNRYLESVSEDDGSASVAPPTTSNVPAEASAGSGSAEGTQVSEVPETVRIVTDVPGESVGNDIGKDCAESCKAMLMQLDLKQADNKSSGRFTVDVIDLKKVQGAYKLTLDRDMMVDDSTGIIIDGREFSSNYVTFNGYDRITRTVMMYPALELRDLIGDGSEITLFTDMVWLVRKTLEFFEGYGDMIAYPETPRPFAASAFLASRFKDMSPDQEAAVKMVLSRPLSYVWGVPGSGKTQYVLATAINECVRRGERVAVIAPTNLALEQVLRGLMRSFDMDESGTIDKAKDVVRIGNPTAEFLKDYATICEDKKVRNELSEKERRLTRYRNLLHERRYEALKGLCDGAEVMSKELDRSEASAEKLMDIIGPLREEMLKDPRFVSNARAINTRTVRDHLGHLKNMVYGRDRSEYLGGEMAELGDGEVRSRIASLERDVDMLRASDPKADINSCKVVSMTLSKFIASFGPSHYGGRTPLEVQHIFVDEAGYCNVVQFMSLFTMGVPITLLGDHLQLPPVCEIGRDDLLTDINDPAVYKNDCLWAMSALYADSFFDEDRYKLARLYEVEGEPEFRYTSRAYLFTTHRFGQNLADVLANRIYGMPISSGGSVETSIRVIDAHIDAYPLMRGKQVRSNERESEEIGRYIKANKPADYAVLTPYNDQVRTLKRNRDIPDDNVLTIHKSQGREWDTVIISVCDGRCCVEDDSLGKTPKLTSTVWGGGVNGRRVINTALSRAKKELIIVCDTAYWLGREGELIGDLVRIAKDAPEKG